jgi:hypothetical protein
MFSIPVVIEVDGMCELDIVDDKAVKLVSEFDGRRVELSWYWGACNSEFRASTAEAERVSCRRQL